MKSDRSLTADCHRYPKTKTQPAPLFILPFIFLSASSVTSLHADEPAQRVAVYLLDPRGAISGTNTLPTEWKGGAADILGTRYLSASEAHRLNKLLRIELTNDDNVPFCGHRPAYAVVTSTKGQSPNSVTLCGGCWTWAQKGKLRVLGGKRTLEYLNSL
ncbi:hypothetical protein, partial [Rhodopirellula sallentina]|uniref:hypothetical protein n=1 Tax=Rhodopirellula sallentina TaxID=1263869 RepID=UPI001F3443D1